MFAHFDLNDIYSLYDLSLLLNIDLNNFLEYITCLKGLKPGYMSHKDVSIFYDVILFIKDLNQDDFIYIPRLKLIFNKNKVETILKKYNKNLDYFNTLTSTYFIGQDSIIIGDILGYPCPGLHSRTKNNSLPISYNLILSDIFKQIFHTNSTHLQIIGSNCLKTDIDSKISQMYLDEYLLNEYFQILHIGTIKLQFTL